MASGRAQGLPGWPETRGPTSQQDLECACAAIVFVLVGECICILVFDVPRAAGPDLYSCSLCLICLDSVMASSERVEMRNPAAAVSNHSRLLTVGRVLF